jgi:hypothetical protein
MDGGGRGRQSVPILLVSAFTGDSSNNVDAEQGIVASINIGLPWIVRDVVVILVLLICGV